MHLPNVETAIVDRAKVVDYLLSEMHEDGRHKAAFFQAFGFRPENWQQLATALKRHAVDHELRMQERRLLAAGLSWRV